MATIGIPSKLDMQIHTADFEAVRTIGSYTLGWATVRTEDCALRFPAITTPFEQNPVMTVSDWQAPWFGGVDLANPEHVANMIRTGQGSFINPRTEQPSEIIKRFCRSAAT